MHLYTEDAAQAKHSPQIIVVGASISGLQAAYDLQRAGISCIVLEARNIIGGNCYRGARVAQFSEAWVNPDEHPRTWNLAHDLGLEMTRETRGKSIMSGFGAYEHDDIPFTDEADRYSYAHILESMETLSQRINHTTHTQSVLESLGGISMTFQDLIIAQGATPAIQKLADTWSTTLLGLAARHVPALDFLLTCKAAGGFLNAIGQFPKRTTHLRIRNPQRLKEALVQRLDHGSILLSQSVVHIDQRSSSKCVLTTTTGDTFECLKVIMAVPPSSYMHLDFRPVLGDSKQWMQEYEPSDFCITTVLVYDQPWWRTKGLSGYSQSMKGPIWETYDTSNDDEGVYALTCTVAGESGRELWNKDIIERRDTILTHLRGVFSMYTAIPDPILRIEPKDTVWTRQASYTAGTKESVRGDGRKVKGRVHFAVPGMRGVQRHHLEEALTSGSRAANEVLTAVMSTEQLILAKL